MSARRDFDVVIAGGGMVGAALAALLATLPATVRLKVALIEPHPPRAPLPNEPLDLRVSALSHAALRILRDVGAWPRLVERQPCAYERMVVWDAAAAIDSRDTLVFDAAELGEPDLGWIAENRAVAAALTERALATGVTLLRESVTGLELGAELARVALGERHLGAGLVVAADGGESPLRALAGITGHATPYPQEAVIAHLRSARPHARTARQRFLASGPLALLPLADGCVSLVWSTSPASAIELLAQDATAFGHAVTVASDGVLGELTLASERARFPLRRYQADRYSANRFVLVGDAAHAVHPLAGQGVNQGLLDARCLVDELAGALARGEGVGDARALGRYARARRADNLIMGMALNALWQLFSDQRTLVGRLRRTGLGLVNRASPLKQLLTGRALGA